VWRGGDRDLEAAMKPAPFEYVAVRSVEEALAALDHEDARVLAGGQSLMPLLNARAVRTARLVDINGAGLGVIRRSGGTLRLGATVRQAALERSSLVADHWPLLAQAVRHVGHAATRSRGTVGGSVAHADPAAQLPAALAALDARYVVAELKGDCPSLDKRGLSPSISSGELLVSIELPPLPDGARTAYAEHARTRGVFADAGAAVVLAPGHAAVSLLGTGRAARAEQALLEGADAREAGALAADEVEGAHRKALVAEVTRRALAEAGCR
jgi:CO/xanthine dehydrogenase FAD-binding subunit